MKERLPLGTQGASRLYRMKYTSGITGPITQFEVFEFNCDFMLFSPGSLALAYRIAALFGGAAIMKRHLTAGTGCLFQVAANITQRLVSAAKYQHHFVIRAEIFFEPAGGSQRA